MDKACFSVQGNSVPTKGMDTAQAACVTEGRSTLSLVRFTVINGFGILNYSGLLRRALWEQEIEAGSRFTFKGRIGTRQFIGENSDPLLNSLKA